VKRTLHPLLAPFVISSNISVTTSINISKRDLGALFKKREKKVRKKKIKRE
jgi:hypothetical protein